MEPRPAASMSTARLEEPAALQRNELPEVPSHDFTDIKHNDPRNPHVSNLVDSASVSSTAVSEADPTSNENRLHKIVDGVQQHHAPPTPVLNSLTPTYLDKCFAESQSRHEVPRVPLVINALQPNPNPASVSKPAAATGGTPQTAMLEATSRSQEPVIARVDNEPRPDLDHPHEPESLITIGIDGTIGNIKHKSHRSTCCGRNLTIEVWQDGVGKPSFATFGGVISIKGRFYGITTAHSFLINLRHSPDWELFDGEREAMLSTASTATSPSTSDDTDSVADSEPGSIANALQTPRRAGEDFESLVYLQPLSRMAYSFQGMTLRPGGKPMPDTSMSDWALFPLQPSVALPNFFGTRLLTSVVPESQLIAGPVSILLGIEASYDGYLTLPTASLHTEHALMEVREIMLKSTLPKGASGAWVVRGAKVCGYVVALIGEGLSCMMIPMERTFREIKELFHEDVEIGPELHERKRENRRVDGAVESLIAATHSAGEALEEFGLDIKLHSGMDPDFIPASKDSTHQEMTSDLSHKAELGTDPEEAINPAIGG